MSLDIPLPLLGGLSPARFMRRHWQKRPLLIRQALPGIEPPLDRAALFALAAREEVESRLIVQRKAGWQLKHGPFARRALPPLTQPRWTLLVQGLDLHDEAAHALMQRFRFVPDARLDDLMVSYATDGGGVGPHFDSYDVFLLQVHGRRRWRIGRQSDLSLQPDVPLKILSHFEPEEEWLLEPGDMLYLPPRWAHDGIAEGECMTCSIGFRSSGKRALARELLQTWLDHDEDDEPGAGAVQDPRYTDPRQEATAHPGAIPAALQQFARNAVTAYLRDPQLLATTLGETLSEPKPGVVFDAPEASAAAFGAGRGLRLDRRSRMLYDERCIYLNGESYRAGGRDAKLLRQLADSRAVPARAAAGFSAEAQSLIQDWIDAGWVHASDAG